MFISFSNGNGSAFENSLDSGYPFVSVPVRCTKDNAVGNVAAETGRDGGTTTRLSDLFNAISALCVAVERRGSTLT